MKFPRELIKGSTKNLILAVLSEGELYGYQIVKEIRNRSKDALQFGEGSIYPALHSLEKEAALRSHWVTQESGPARKYYRITPKGRKVLNTEIKAWKGFTMAVNQVLNPHYFSPWISA